MAQQRCELVEVPVRVLGDSKVEERLASRVHCVKLGNVPSPEQI
eukprot:CAMPEP_0119417354 /NCGR_PEP_ID=MMETSP1335-20130426/15590_1 /TAXON_ID=259385 /ORGANISM="Chrysoculter rhomboideus, Strain RCC1486" /LENGTH=43 /DNA_ID= /DNA_START= /DNA_END= /DNA_ORIENTATION=